MEDAKLREKQFWLIALVVVLLFGRSVGFSFMRFDDSVYLHGNELLQNLSWGNLWAFWTEPFAALYIPVSMTLFLVEWGLTKSPGLFHGVNVLLHLGSTLFVLAIARQLFRAPWVAFLAATFFAVHPYQAETVSWISCQRDLLGGMFGFGGIYFFLRALPEDQEGKVQRRFYLWSIIFFILSLLSKPNLIALPGVTMIVAYLHRPSLLKKSSVLLAPWFLASLLAAVIAKSLQPDHIIEAWVTPLHTRPVIVGDVLWFYLSRLFVPVDFNPEHGRLSAEVLASGWSYVTALVPVVVLILLLKLRLYFLAATCLIVAVAISPVSGIIPFHYQRLGNVAEHYMYPAMLGPALAFGWLISRRPVTTTFRFATVMLALCAAWTFYLSGFWREELVLYTRLVEKSPKTIIGLTNLGTVLSEAGRADLALPYYRRIRELRTNEEVSNFNEGLALIDVGQVEEGISLMRFSYTIEKAQTEPVDFRLAAMLRNLERYQQAEKYFELALLPPAAPNWQREALKELENLYRKQKKYDKAASAVRRYLELAPGDAIAHNNLAGYLARQKKFSQADIYFKKATELAPDVAEVRLSWAEVLSAQRRMQEAEAQRKVAAQIRNQQSEFNE